MNLSRSARWSSCFTAVSVRRKRGRRIPFSHADAGGDARPQPGDKAEQRQCEVFRTNLEEERGEVEACQQGDIVLGGETVMIKKSVYLCMLKNE